MDWRKRITLIHVNTQGKKRFLLSITAQAAQKFLSLFSGFVPSVHLRPARLQTNHCLMQPQDRDDPLARYAKRLLGDFISIRATGIEPRIRAYLPWEALVPS